MTLKQEILLGNYLGNLLWSIPSCYNCGKPTFHKGKVCEDVDPQDAITVPLCEDCEYKLTDNNE